jgi:tetratricopeptide (TPR) repeat protein
MRVNLATKGEGRGGRGVAFLFIAPFTFLLSPLVLPVRADGPAAQHYQTGLAYERLGRYDESYTELQLAVALDQDNVQKEVALGILACRLGRLEVAQRALERSIELDSNSIASYFHLGLLYEKTGATERALDMWHRFLSLSQDEPLKGMAKKHIQYLESRANG